MKIERNLLCKICLLAILLVLLAPVGVNAQSNLESSSIKEIKGKVVDENSDPIVGATVSIKNTTTGTFTDVNGSFSLNVKSIDILSVTYVGYEPQEILVGDQANFNIQLAISSQTMDEVVVTAWGKEKKTTMVGSVATVNPKELKGPTSNLTTMLAGRVAGVIAYQTSGEPGRDNAEFFVRGITSFGTGKVSPLILINGIESSNNDLARIQPDDIESFSVLKDGTAASMYGSRGANGVVLVTTRGGELGKTKFNVRYETSVSENTRRLKLSDNITYMKMANEARLTRDDLATRLYSEDKITRTAAGMDPFLYPNNNWFDLMIRDNTINHRVNFNINGGTERVKYYLSGTYKQDNGMFNELKLNSFNTNVKSISYEVRSNVDVKLTSTTNMSVRLSGLFTNYSGPAEEGTNVFKSLYKANPVAFPAVYPQEYLSWAKHPLFGNTYMSAGSTGSLYYNPYADMLSGYKEDNTSKMNAQVEFTQDLKFLTPGLKARVMAYTTRYSSYTFKRTKSPYYYSPIVNPITNQIESLTELNVGEEWLTFRDNNKYIDQINWIEGSIDYTKAINSDHQVGAAILGYVGETKIANPTNDGGKVTLDGALPYRKVSLSGRLTYDYKSRYLAEFNFGYNGSERFNKNNRFGFFPSFGAAWVVSNEPFMQPLSNILTNFKIRGTYGILGNDDISSVKDGRFFYTSLMNMSSGTYYFGNNYGYSRNGISISKYGNPYITWEKSKKQNLALEIGLFNDLSLEVDFFKEKRSQIAMDRVDIPGSMGLNQGLKASVGEAESKGFEVSLDYKKTLNKDMWMTVRGTFSYASSKLLYSEEPDYGTSAYYRSKTGHSISQKWGYLAERLFVDDSEVANSPVPNQYRDQIKAGDIKYRDVNGDDQITEQDMVPMGNPTVPEVIYGFGFSYGYKDFDINAYFQGEARSSFFIEANMISPFLNTKPGQEFGVLQDIADNYWSENNRDIYAFYPRLSYTYMGNNYMPSNWWLRDGGFIRLKTVELGYEPRGSWLKKVGLGGFRVYINGMNLLTLSNFKLWDVEMKGKGMGYPIQRVFNGGLRLTF